MTDRWSHRRRQSARVSVWSDEREAVSGARASDHATTREAEVLTRFAGVAARGDVVQYRLTRSHSGGAHRPRRPGAIPEPQLLPGGAIPVAYLLS
jgi:hypothetical protein